MKGFIDFIREQGVVGLAIGFILGAASKDLVSSFVDGIIQPLIGLIFGGKASLAEASIVVNEVSIEYGAFISAVFDFMILVAIVYFGIKGFGLDKLDIKKS
ncbi:MAG: MscL family protein [bacterium]|nr:MscL family protein [bacterium]